MYLVGGRRRDYHAARTWAAAAVWGGAEIQVLRHQTGQGRQDWFKNDRTNYCCKKKVILVRNSNLVKNAENVEKNLKLV